MSRPSSGTLKTQTGRLNPTPAIAWLVTFVVLLLFDLVALLGFTALWRALLPENQWLQWEPLLMQALLMPLLCIGPLLFAERSALRHRPRVVQGVACETQIRDRSNGKLLATLAGENLREVALPGAKLQRASLWGEELDGANLSGADLRGAWLRGAILDGADLSGANLSGADLKGASLRGTDLRAADLRGASLAEVDLAGVLFDDATQWDTSCSHSLRSRGHQQHPETLPVPAPTPIVDADTLPRFADTAVVLERKP